jgi:hypothetical protein
MGLFGAIKTAGDRITASMNEWMGGDYLKVAAVTGGLLFVEEFLSSLAVNMLKWTGGKAVAIKTAGRVALSGLYYYVVKDRTVALAASITPIALTFSELFAYLIGYAPAEASKAVASMIRRSLGIEETQPAVPQPSPVPALAVVPEVTTPPPPPPPAPAPAPAAHAEVMVT